ncbi:MAG: tyrosine-type recombinase/integrase, partial [Nitrospinota bacterium]
MERGIVLNNPAAHVKVPRVAEDHRPDEAPKRNSTILETEAQIQAFTKKACDMLAPPKPWGAFFTLAVYSGLREGEILALQWGDINFDGKHPILSVRRSWDRDGGYILPKSKAAVREVPLLPEARRALVEWRVAAPSKGPKDRVFPIGPGGYKRALRGLLAALREETKG